ncbi:uncharacterized protein [Chlorocebus sabaeus]|uniref:uncharacterized protein n=1 Tax=Chlorocebus sabaeus TaxID=60711 RepID=UPI003BFA36DE
MELKGSVWHRRSEGVLRPPRPRPRGCGEAGPGTPSHPGPSPPLPVRPVPGFQVSAPARQAALHLRGIARDSALWIFRSSASQIRCPEPVQTWSVGPRPAGPCGSRSRRTSSRSPESAIQPGPPFSSDTRSLRPLRPTDLSDPVSLAKPLGARLHRGGHATPGSRSQAASADRWGCSPGQAPLGSRVLLAGPGSPRTPGGKSQARSPPCLRRGASLATRPPRSSSAGRSGAGTGTPRPPDWLHGWPGFSAEALALGAAWLVSGSGRGKDSLGLPLPPPAPPLPVPGPAVCSCTCGTGAGWRSFP